MQSPQCAQASQGARKAPQLNVSAAAKIMLSKRPAFSLVVPTGCEGDVCHTSGAFFDMIEQNLPGIAWLCNCSDACWADMCENLGTGSSPRIVHWHAGQWQPHKASSPESLLQAVRDAYEPSPLSSKPLAAPSEQTDPVAKLRKLADETDSEAIVEAAVRGIDSPSEDVKESACGLLERAVEVLILHGKAFEIHHGG